MSIRIRSFLFLRAVTPKVKLRCFHYTGVTLKGVRGATQTTVFAISEFGFLLSTFIEGKGGWVGVCEKRYCNKTSGTTFLF